MSTTELLVLAHLGSTAVLLVVLWSVICVQALGRLLHQLLHLVPSPDEPTTVATTARRAGADRPRAVHPST